MFTTHLLSSVFFFNDTATTEIYTLSLHDALPISRALRGHGPAGGDGRGLRRRPDAERARRAAGRPARWPVSGVEAPRSEEHTSELQSHLNLLCRLLL